jgi:hypothetical protein
VRAAPSLIHRVLDPSVEARDAQVDRLLAIDLAFQLLFTHPLYPSDQSFNLNTDILVKILLGDDWRLRIGDGIDPDEVVIASTGMDLLRAPFAV